MVKKNKKKLVKIDLEEYNKEIEKAIEPAPEYIRIQKALRELERLLYA